MSGISSVAAVTQLTDAIRTSLVRRTNLRRQDARVETEVLQEATDRINARRDEALDANAAVPLATAGQVAGPIAPLGLVEFEQFISSVGNQAAPVVPPTPTPVRTGTSNSLPLLDGADLVALRLSSDVSAFGLQASTLEAALLTDPTSNVVPLPEGSASLGGNAELAVAQSVDAYNRVAAIPAGAPAPQTSATGVAVNASAIQAALAAQPLTQQGSNSQESVLAKYGTGQRSQGNARAVVPNERRRRSTGFDFETFE